MPVHGMPCLFSLRRKKDASALHCSKAGQTSRWAHSPWGQDRWVGAPVRLSVNGCDPSYQRETPAWDAGWSPGAEVELGSQLSIPNSCDITASSDSGFVQLWPTQSQRGRKLVSLTETAKCRPRGLMEFTHSNTDAPPAFTILSSGHIMSL